MAAPRTAFPALRERPELCYLDSAATALLPQVALDAMIQALGSGGSAGRGGHPLAQQASEALEDARRSVAQALALSPHDLVLTGSATDALLLAAEGAVGPGVGPGDRIVVGADAHHAHLLPWRAVAERHGAELVVVGLGPSGELDRAHLAEVLGPRVRAVALTHVSNVTGAVLPVARVAEQVRAVAPDAWVVVDGTQAVPHLPVRPTQLDADLYVWSAHKAYGPMGCGFAWSRRWDEVRPVRWGGGMVSSVGDHGFALRDVPARFEAGTLNHPAAVGAAAGMAFLGAHRDLAAESAWIATVCRQLSALPGVRVLGTPAQRVGVVSFVVDGVHPHDVAEVCAADGVAVRAGHFCAQPMLRALGVPAATRASVGLATTDADAERLVACVARAASALGSS